MSLIDVVSQQPGVGLQPGLSEAELRQFQQTLPGPLPANVRNLLRLTRGIDVPGGEPVDFTGRSHWFQLDDPALSHPVAVASTVTGNFWVVNVAGDGTWGPVFYACHDPWMVCVAFEGLAEFIECAAHPKRLREKAESLQRFR